MPNDGALLARHSLLLGVARGIGQLIMLLVFAALARLVGAERLGTVATALAVATVASGLVDFGASAYWVREYSAGRLRDSDFKERIAGKLIAGALLALSLALLFPIWFDSLLTLGASMVLLASVLSQTFQMVLVAVRANGRLLVISMVERLVLGVSFIILLLLTPATPETAFFLGYLAGAIVLAIAVLVWIPFLRPDFLHFAGRRTWAGSGAYGAYTVLTSLQSADVILGAAIGGPSVAGSYGAVQRWTMPIKLITNSFATLLAPVVAGAADRHQVWQRVRKVAWVPGVSLAAALIMAIGAEPLVILVLGPSFAESVPTLRILAVAAAVSSCAQVIATVLQARNRARTIAVSQSISVVLQLLLIIPLVKTEGTAGLAFAALIGQLTFFALVSVTTLRVLRKS